MNAAKCGNGKDNSTSPEFLKWCQECLTKDCLSGSIKGGFKKSTKSTSSDKDTAERCKSENHNDGVDPDSGERPATGSVDAEAAQKSRLAWIEGSDTNSNSQKSIEKTPKGNEKDTTAADSASPTPGTDDELDLSDAHPDVRKAVEFALPFYKKLYECRVTLDEVKRLPELY